MSKPSLVERVSDFVSENKRAVIIGTAAAALAIGGVAYYAASSSSRPVASDVEKADKKKSSKKKKSTKDKDGPILEERKPKDLGEDVQYTTEQIAAMSTEERMAAAAQLKQRGNTVYQSRKFGEAAELYTRAIQVSPKPEPVFYSNRAACYINMTPPLLERVVEDCDAALNLDSKYVKALNRRATALENLDKLEQALRDYTAATILEKFANEQTAHSVERVLKKLSTDRAQEMLSTREPRLPSHNFVSAYFAAFRARPQPQLPENPSTGDNTFLLAVQALEAADYIHAMSFVGEAITQGITTPKSQAEALNLRGTFRFLVGDVSGAKEDLEKSLELVPSFTQSWVKIASVHMEQGDAAKAFECFEEAIKHNPQDPDIYYHRGQVRFIMNDFDEAAQDYTKSTELDDQFVFSHIQLAVAKYKSGNIGSSMGTFRSTLKAFPTRSEPQNYYGELLLDQGRFQDAVEKFDRAIEIEKARPIPNVLALVNKGLALYQWQQDINGATECCQEALSLDAECEAAIATLAQLALQQGKIEEAIGHFERQVELARTEPELVNALTYMFASRAQAEFLKSYPGMAAELNQMARAM